MRWELEIYVLSDLGVAVVVVSNSLVTVKLHRYEPTKQRYSPVSQLCSQLFVQTSQKRDTM